MGVFNKNKLVVKKVANQDKILFFMNYVKVQNPKDFISEFMQEFNSDYDIFVVINTNMFYCDPKFNIEEKINLIKKELDKQGIRYHEVITKKENDVIICGFSVKKSEVVNSYQIGLIISPGEFNKMEEIVKTNNHFCYVICDQIEKEELFHKFIEVRGDYEEFNQMIGLYIYIDYNLQRISINCSQEHVQFTEERVNRIVNKYNK